MMKNKLVTSPDIIAVDGEAIGKIVFVGQVSAGYVYSVPADYANELCVDYKNTNILENSELMLVAGVLDNLSAKIRDKYTERAEAIALRTNDTNYAKFVNDATAWEFAKLIEYGFTN